MTAAFAARPMVGKPALAREIGVTPRTIDRWRVDPILDFPKPVKINHRLYFFRDEIEWWVLDRARMSMPARDR